MDSWATDGFYSHFPSYSQQPNRREALAKARQLDYQTFLSRISPLKNVSNVKTHKRATQLNDGQSKKSKKPTNASASPTTNDRNGVPKLDMHMVSENNSSTEQTVLSGRSTDRSKDRNDFVNGLEQMDLPDIFNDKQISVRNEKLAEEKRLRNLQYKQELMAQIEQKRRERELQRLKEEEEEARLTRKLEEQMRTVRLQDELDFERRPRYRDHHLVSIELNKPIINTQCKRMPATERCERPINPNAYRSYDQRKAQSDHGKENVDTPKRNDKEIYNFFTNSARRQLRDIRHSHYFDVEESSENDATSVASSAYNTYPNRHHHNESQQVLCSFCKNSRQLSRSQDENLSTGYICNSCENDPICLSCRKEICMRCKRTIQNEENAMPKQQTFQLKQRTYVDNELMDYMRAIEYPMKSYSVRDEVPPYIENYQEIQTDNEDDSLSDQSSSCEQRPLYSFNIDKSSIFHPSKSTFQHPPKPPANNRRRRLSVSIRNGETVIKPDSFDELKRITDEKLAKMTKTYQKNKANQTIESKEPNDQNDSYESLLKTIAVEDSIMVPKLRENTKRLIEFAKELERTDCNLHARDRCDEKSELKCQNSAARKKTIVEFEDADTSTLIQIGAIAKEMQSDKLNH